jgi:putative tricarboxylic transport membrane protein
MHLPDRFTGGVLVALGGLAAWQGSKLPPVPGQDVGPEVFPMVIGISLAFCGMLIALGIGQRYEHEAEAELAAHSDQPPPEALPPRWGGLKVLLPPGLLFFYMLAVERLGFVPTAFVIVFALALALGASLRLATPLAIAAPIAVHLVFSKLLRVPLPAGLLPMPW